MGYEWAFIANWLIFGGLTLVAMDPFDLFGGDDDPEADDPVDTTGETLIGTDAPETLTGGDLDDALIGLGGDDLLIGGAGNDGIEGNTGDDTLRGGDGDDLLAGGAGTDLIEGGAGNDVLSSDRLDGDAQWERGGEETLSGGDGDDALFFLGDDVAIGGAGQDVFSMIVAPEGGAASLRDYDPEADRITLHATFDADSPPEVGVSADAVSGITTVLLDGRAVMEVRGVFTAAQLDVGLRQIDELPF